MHGYAIPRPGSKLELVGSITDITDDPRYRWLNDVVCALTGEGAPARRRQRPRSRTRCRRTNAGATRIAPPNASNMSRARRDPLKADAIPSRVRAEAAIRFVVSSSRVRGRLDPGRLTRGARSGVAPASRLRQVRPAETSGMRDPIVRAELHARLTRGRGSRPAYRIRRPFGRTTRQTPPNSVTFWQRIWPGFLSPT
jgi:hypothetical protein